MDDLIKSHIVRLDHIGFAVHRIGEALPLFRDLLGGEYSVGNREEGGGFAWAQLNYPGGKIELLEPLGEDSFLHAFLRQRGEGVHHITFYVRQIEALVEKLRARGLRIVDEDYSNPAWKEAFISPRSAHGTVIQLAETDHEENHSSEAPDLEWLSA